jgi:DNA-binding transcriptional MerR regulator
MQILNQKLTKLYYSIGEVAEMFNVNASLIRFWEKEFSILKLKKNKKGNRMFMVKDIQNLELIYDLVKHKGFTLEGANKRISELHKGGGPVKKNESINNEVVFKLKAIKSKLLLLDSK